MPFQYRVHKMTARDDPAGQDRLRLRARRPAAAADADARRATSPRATSRTSRRSSRAGGQRGPQRKILREGTYAINLAQFVVVTEGKRLLPAARAAKRTASSAQMAAADRGARRLRAGRDQGRRRHDRHRHRPRRAVARRRARSSRRRSATIRATPRRTTTTSRIRRSSCAAGGSRGRQLQVLVEGTYYINRLFATVEMIPKTVVEVGNVGVVVSYTGETGVDLSGERVQARRARRRGTARRLERAAPARQVRVQHVRRQGASSCRRPTSS